MKNKIVYANAAVSGLEEIRNYIGNELFNPTVALEMVNGILDKVDRLADFPNSGKALYFDELNSGYRYVQYKKYIAFYHVYDNCIFVDRVLYAKRNYQDILKNY